MKGMQKIVHGTGFRGVLNYAADRDSPDAEPGRLLGGNMSGTTPRELATEFGVIRQFRPDIEKPVWHQSLRLPKGDRMTDEEWVKFADDYMERMGFTGQHARTYWLHDDADGQHIHIVACRVSLDSKVHDSSHQSMKSTPILMQMEREYGLTLTPGPKVDENGKVIMPEKRKLKKGEIERALRTGEEPPRQKLQRLLDEAMEGRPTVLQFAERMEAAGVVVIANMAKTTDKMSGFSFRIDGVPFSASQAGDKYKWSRLTKVIDYDEARDSAELRQYTAAARSSAERAGTTESDRTHAASPTDAAVARRPSESAGASGPVVGITDRREPGRDSAGRSGGDDGGETARRDGGEASQGSEAARANIPAIAGIQPGTGESQAPQPLASRFSFKPADSGAYQRVLDLGGALVKNPGHRAKLDAWGQQHATLQAPAYRLTLTSRRDNLKTYRYGKTKGEEREKTYTAQEIAQMLPTLSRQNARGYDIYITPIDQAHHYMVVDDMTPATVDRLKRSGFEPTLIQTSSQGNQQCILKVPRKPDQKDEQKLANQLVQHFNRELGDPNFSGVIHPFRMAGFSNKKPGRGDFFTRIIQGGHRICGRAAQALEEMREAIRKRLQAAQDAKRQVEQVKTQEAERIRLDALWSDSGGNHQDKLCRDAYQAVLRQVKGAGWQLDMSRVDYSVAKVLHQRGLSEQTIERLLTEHSPSLHDRHSNPQDYARRTVQNALIDLSTEVERQAQRSRNSAISGYDRKGDSSSILRPKG